MKTFPATMRSELRAVGVYLYGGEFPASPAVDNRTLILGTARTPQERDVDCGRCQPDAPGPQSTVGRTQRIQGPVRWLFKTCSRGSLGLSRQHRPHEVCVWRDMWVRSSHSADSGRQGVASTRKVQSNLLASVLVLTIVPVTAKVSQAAIDHCCFLICRKLTIDEVNSD